MSFKPSSIDALVTTFEPQTLLDTVAPRLSELQGSSRIGLATLESARQSFRNIAIWDREDASNLRGTSFSARGAAAGWVCEYSCPIVGKTIRDMERYPVTYSYLIRERFHANAIIPMDLGPFGRCVLYSLARTAGAFDQSSVSVALRVREILQPAIRAHLAARDFMEGSTGDGAAPTTRQGTEAPPERPQTLDDVQAMHIRNVLTMTNGLIEGPRGAASILGLRPSTLRNRMKRLGVERPGPLDHPGR